MLPFGHSNIDSRAVAVGDMDDDGNMDIMVGNYGHYNQLLYMTEKGAFRDTVIFGGEREKTPDLFVVDMNNDGKKDILCAHMGKPNSIFIATDDPKSFVRQDMNEHVFNTSSIVGLDLNQDGLIDIAETNMNHKNVYYTQDSIPSDSSAISPVPVAK